MRTWTTRTFIAVALVSALTAAAARGEELQGELPVAGRHERRGPFRGRVQVEGAGAALLVRQSLEFEDGRVQQLAGPGRREGRTVVATLTPTVGVTDVVRALGEGPEEHAPLTLHLQTDRGGARWRLRLSRDGRVVATASGERLPDVASVRSNDPGGLTPGVEGLHTFEGVPFVEGPGDGRDIHESDPRQGGLGNCYLISALIAVARARPEAIRAMIADRGDGTYVVTLKDVGRFWLDSRQTVDQRFPYVTQGDARAPAYAQLADHQVLADGRVLHELWPMMIEKAWAQWKGGYQQTESGNPTTVYDFIGGAGKTDAFWAKDRGAAALGRALQRAQAAGKPVTLGFPDANRGP
ncbi:MAG: hypothetical protein KIT58_20305, partial [Planctomycetota bacterium]|nr:hypothetical protein [Planctomycetota bacterium]